MTMLTAKKVRVGVTGAAPCFIDSSDEPMKLTVSSHISWLRLSRLGMTHASAEVMVQNLFLDLCCEISA